MFDLSRSRDRPAKRRCLRHNVNYVKAMTADVTMSRTELFETPKSWHLSKICFIPLDAISKVMY